MPKQSVKPPEVVVAVSIGGTKLIVGVMSRKGLIKGEKGSEVSTFFLEGDWRRVFKISYGPDDGKDATKRKEAEERLIKGMAKWMGDAFKAAKDANYDIKDFGVSTKGPVEKGTCKDVDFVKVGPCTTLPFNGCKLDKELKQALTDLDVQIAKLDVHVQHDGAAAALGERKWFLVKNKGAKDMDDFAAVIIGTGVGVGVIKGGLVYEGINPDVEGNDNERNLGSLGRHLVCVMRHESPVPGYWPDSCCYQYRGAHLNQKYAPICRESGEIYFTERVAGPWLAKEIARLLKQYYQDNPRPATDTLAAMQLTTADVERFLSLESEDGISKALQKKILEGLTDAAKARDQWARYQIAAIGAEIGAALGEFILAFQDRVFINKIILVSTVSEKLGAGVAADSGTFTPNDNDLLISRVRTAAQTVLSKPQNGVNRKDADKLAKGITRSLLGGDRELWAFLP